MNPTVGRQVHLYTSGLRWHRGRRTSYDGPFAATVVRVNEGDGTVNLHVLYPSELDWGYSTPPCASEILEDVIYSELTSAAPRWVWPPRA